MNNGVLQYIYVCRALFFIRRQRGDADGKDTRGHHGKRRIKKNTEEAYDLISAGDCNVVFPVVPFAFPPQRGLYEENGFITPASPADYMKRSQDFRPVYHDCGQFYFYRVDSFLGSGSTVDHARPLIISEMEVQDIDTLTDWELAEMKYRLRKSSEGKEDRDGSIR